MERRLGEQLRRDRSFRLEDLLACPDCLADELDIAPEHVRYPLRGA